MAVTQRRCHNTSVEVVAIDLLFVWYWTQQTDAREQGCGESGEKDEQH